MSTRSRAVLAALIAVGLMAAACGSGSSPADTAGERSAATGDGAPRPGGSIVDLQNFAQGEPDHIDPALASTIQGSQPGQLIFDGLTETDYQTGKIVPNVAERWSANDDATQWTFTMRRDVTWSDGTPVRPSDFKYAWERVVSPDLASEVSYHILDNAPIRGAKDVAAGTAQEIAGIVADDDAMTLQVTLEEPVGFFPTIVSHLVFSPVPAAIVRALPNHGRDWEQGVMIGNGPYKMDGPWQHEQAIKLVRNERYWGGHNNHAPYLDAIEMRISKDLDSAYSAFEAGQGDTGYIPPARFAEARTRYADRLLIGATLGIYYWGFNMDDPEVGGPQNVKLRQAISSVIDRQRMVDQVYNNTRKVASGITPPGVPGQTDNLAEYGTRDLDRARQLLGEWEKATGKTAASLAPIKLNFGRGAGHAENAQIIQANLAELNIRSELDPRETTTYFTEMRRGQGQFLRAGWIWDYVHYDNGMFPLFDSASIGGDNLTQYRSSEFDRLISEARRTTDEAKADDLYRAAEKLVLNTDTVVVPLNWYAGSVVFSQRLRNVIQSPLQFLAYDEMWIAG